MSLRRICRGMILVSKLPCQPELAANPSAAWRRVTDIVFGEVARAWPRLDPYWRAVACFARCPLAVAMRDDEADVEPVRPIVLQRWLFGEVQRRRQGGGCNASSSECPGRSRIVCRDFCAVRVQNVLKQTELLCRKPATFRLTELDSTRSCGPNLSSSHIVPNPARDMQGVRSGALDVDDEGTR